MGKSIGSVFGGIVGWFKRDTCLNEWGTLPKTIEGLKEKLLRLSVPLKTSEEKDPDLEIMDPLEV
jgi:hypothetical protein